MKKYTQPELSISMFDIEDVITNSGVMTTLDNIATVLGGGKLYTDANLSEESVSTDAAAFFAWR